MERGPAGVTEVLLVLLLVLLSVPFVTTPVVRAQSGQWVVTTSIQTSLSMGVATVTLSGSGSAYLSVDGQGQITGTGSFQGSVTVTASTGCSGGGTWQLSESEVYSGRMVNWATGNATLTVTASGSAAPTTVTITCPNPSPPPATITYSLPIPSQMATSSGSFSVLLADRYTHTQSFPAPMTGGYSISIRGGVASTTTTTSTTSATLPSGSLSLAVPYGDVRICDSDGNCVPAVGGEILQPGQCIVTFARSGAAATSSNMEVAIGENSEFCLPATKEGISSLCTQAQIYATIQGQLHVGTWGMSLGQNVYVRTNSAGVCDTGTEFMVETSDTGTKVMVLNRTVMVTDLASNSTVTMGSGQMMTVQSSPSGMGQMAMQQAVESFDPGSVDRWRLSSGTPTTASTAASTSPAEIPNLAYAAVAAAFVLAVAALALSRIRSKRIPPPPGD